MVSKRFFYVLIIIAVLGFGSYTFWHANRQQTAKVRKIYKATSIDTSTKVVPEQVSVETSADLAHEAKLPNNGTELVKSIMTEEQRTYLQDYFKVTESDEFRAFLKTKPTLEERFNFLSDQGIGDLPRNLNMLLFRKSFPTGDPVDFEPEMRQKLMQMLIEAGVGPSELVPSEVITFAQTLTTEEKDYVNDLLDQYSVEEAVNILQTSDPKLAKILQYGAEKGLEDEIARSVTKEFWADKRTRHWQMGYFKGKVVGEGGSYEWAQEVLSHITSPTAAERAFTKNSESHSFIQNGIDAPMTSDTIAPQNPEESGVLEVLPAAEELHDTPSDSASTLIDTAETSTASGIEFYEPLTEEEFNTELRKQFSPRRLNSAMQLLNRYGPKEGIRRLKESDPEFAKQLEHHIGKSKEEQ